jgi:hypothetical protein
MLWCGDAHHRDVLASPIDPRATAIAERDGLCLVPQ